MMNQEQIAKVLEEHRPTRWRSFTNDNEVLRCCGQDFGNLTRRATRDDAAKAWESFAAHQAAVLAPLITAVKAEAWSAGNLAGDADAYMGHMNGSTANPYEVELAVMDPAGRALVNGIIERKAQG